MHQCAFRVSDRFAAQAGRLGTAEGKASSFSLQGTNASSHTYWTARVHPCASEATVSLGQLPSRQRVRPESKTEVPPTEVQAHACMFCQNIKVSCCGQESWQQALSFSLYS